MPGSDPHRPGHCTSRSSMHEEVGLLALPHTGRPCERLGYWDTGTLECWDTGIAGTVGCSLKSLKALNACHGYCEQIKGPKEKPECSQD